MVPPVSQRRGAEFWLPKTELTIMIAILGRAWRVVMTSPFRIFRFVVAMCLVGVAWSAAAQERPRRPHIDEAPLRAALDQGLTALKAKKCADALKLFESVDRTFTEAYAKGPRAWCARSPKEATAYLLMATVQKVSSVAIGPLWCDAIYFGAYCQTELGRTAEAAGQLDRALAMAPRNSQYLSERADLLVRQRKLDTALDMFRQAEEFSDFTPNPDSAKLFRSRACRGVGYVLIEQGKLDDAEATYRHCLEIDPNDRKSFRELGYIASQRSNKR